LELTTTLVEGAVFENHTHDAPLHTDDYVLPSISGEGLDVFGEISGL